MATNDQSIVIGIFDDAASADKAVAALQRAGFHNEQIRHTTEEGIERSRPSGIKALFTPEKAMHRKSVTEDLVHMGVDPEDARIYQREYEEGHPLVSVAGRGNMQDAITILANQGAHGPEEQARRGTAHRTAEYTGGVAGTQAGETRRPGAERAERVGETRTPGAERAERVGETRTPGAERAERMGGTRAGETRASDVTSAAERAARTTRERTGETIPAETAEAQKIRLHAERLRAYKQPEEVGRVNVRKEVVTEQQTLNVPVSHEEVVVERHPVAEGEVPTGETIGRDETIRIPVSEERVNVGKETVTTGEVEISKRQVQENRQFTGKVRREEAQLEKEGDIPIVGEDADQPPDQPRI